MDKIIVMVRTSTDTQSTSDQHREMEEFCLSEGWKSEQIIWVEEEGASAAKVDDTYRSMIDRVKMEVENNPDIKCFAVWHLNRLARTEEVWIEIKSFFVSRKVQIICKNPYLKLLTPDGSVDPGIELAMGLLAILSKQDNEERKAKFHRAKSAMAKAGKYVGGNTLRYGYAVNEQGFFIEKPDESSVVRQVYELYATGKYSSYTLSAELDSRGIYIKPHKITNILNNPAYAGEEVSNSGMHYPPIVSKDLYEEVKKVRSQNKIDMKKKGISLGAKLIKCYKCGSLFTSNSRHYACCRNNKHDCDNGLKLRQSIADALLWKVAELEHLDYLTNLTADKENEYRQNIMLLKHKLAALDEKIEKCVVKKARIAESYMDGLIDRENRDLRLLKVKDEESVHLAAKAALQERIDAISRLLEGIDKDEDFINALADAAVLEYTDEEKFEIVHKHIVSLVAKPMSYGVRDPRTHKPNAVHITITTALGKAHEYLYFPKLYQKHQLYVKSLGNWIADD